MSKKNTAVVEQGKTAEQGSTPEQVAERAMDATYALEILRASIPALEYLEKVAQGTVNADADVIVATRAQAHEVDAQNISASWKSKTKTSKAISAVERAIAFAILTQKAELMAEALKHTKKA